MSSGNRCGPTGARFGHQPDAGGRSLRTRPGLDGGDGSALGVCGRLWNIDPVSVVNHRGPDGIDRELGPRPAVTGQ